MKQAGVFVFGDIGRSPRMQNHAVQISATHMVYFMGYFQNSPPSQVLQNQNIKLVDLRIGGLSVVRKISFYLYAITRVMLQICQILYLLAYKYRNLEFVLVQNPPSIPNLFAIWLASKVSRFKMVIDFHNYGYTILELGVKNQMVIGFAKLYEKYFARKANLFFCVSDKMGQDLKQNWGISAITLYDRPNRKIPDSKFNKNAFLQKYHQHPTNKNQLLLVSSTSWTKDEDFSILLNALQLFEQTQSTTKIRTFITGKGPEKEHYIKIIESRRDKWKKISIHTLWLEADDYPILLSLCDLGVCLHYSSSGLDLPMKVVDMFGAGLPVLAIGFPALPELVQHGSNGFVFDSDKQLFQRISQLASNRELLDSLKQNVVKQRNHDWHSEWEMKARQLLCNE